MVFEEYFDEVESKAFVSTCYQYSQCLWILHSIIKFNYKRRQSAGRSFKRVGLAFPQQFQNLYLIQNNMKRAQPNQADSSKNAKQLSKFSRNQQRLARITEKFASINKNLLQKTESQPTSVNAQAVQMAKLANLEQRMELSMRNAEEKILSCREKLQSVRQKQHKIEISYKQKSEIFSQKLKYLKIKFNSLLFQQHYEYQQFLGVVSQQFQKALQKAYQNKQLFNDKLVKKDLIKIGDRLTKGLNELRNESQVIQSEEKKTIQSVVGDLQSKISQLKQKLNQAAQSHQQTSKDVKHKVQATQQELKCELAQQRAVRQQNKQKLLTLLQTNIGHSLNKSIK